MKIRWLAFLLLFSGSLYAQDFPQRPDPPKLVNDLANMLTDQERQLLENKLVAFDDSTSTQIAIVTVASLNGYDVSDYSFELAELWGIGQAGTDNGILILIAPGERRMFIATGYGVEAFVPDAIAKRIVEGTLKPNFRNEAYFVGLDQATNLLMGLVSGKFSAKQLEDESPKIPFLLILVIFIIVIIVLARRGKGSGGYRGRGPGGHTYMGPMRGGTTWTDFKGGSGSFGGGGFGGFGGGSFGGGGAGGSW